MSNRGRTRATTGRPPPRPRSRTAVPGGRDAPPPRVRFLATDRYRADREWKRYEGTPQRDLFRELRTRFLRRQAVDARWAVDVGSGPGRFTPEIGGPKSRRVALDLSVEMLRRGPAEPGASGGAGAPAFERVVGDAMAPPLLDGGFGEVAVVGNSLGFAGRSSEAMLASVERLVAPGGTLVLEIAPGPGERSRYLHRLPPGAVARLLAAPPAVVVPRILREGFAPEAERHASRGFERLDAERLRARWRATGWEPLETVAVAPCLGADPETITPVRADPRAWEHLLAVEEEVGRRPERWTAAAAVLAAARRGLRG